MRARLSTKGRKWFCFIGLWYIINRYKSKLSIGYNYNILDLASGLSTGDMGFKRVPQRRNMGKKPTIIMYAAYRNAMQVRLTK